MTFDDIYERMKDSLSVLGVDWKNKHKVEVSLEGDNICFEYNEDKVSFPVNRPAKRKASITKEELLETYGEFTRLFNHEFFIETKHGSFVWLDPDYGGNNTIREVPFKYQDYIKRYYPPAFFGRSKGTHRIADYCGSEFTIVET